MRGQRVNRVSGNMLIVLSLTALLAVLSGYALPPNRTKARRPISFSCPSWRGCR